MTHYWATTRSKRKSKKNLKKYLKTNENESTTNQHFGDVAKTVVLSGHFTVINAYIFFINAHIKKEEIKN